jgi:hypothetical protein
MAFKDLIAELEAEFNKEISLEFPEEILELFRSLSIDYELDKFLVGSVENLLGWVVIQSPIDRFELSWHLIDICKLYSNMSFLRFHLGKFTIYEFWKGPMRPGSRNAYLKSHLENSNFISISDLYEINFHKNT